MTDPPQRPASAAPNGGTDGDPQAEVRNGAQVGAHAVVHPDAVVGEGTVLGAHAVVHGGAVIGMDVTLGSHVVVHSGTHVGSGCVIEDHVVLGKRPRLAANSPSEAAALGQLVLGAEVKVCTAAIVFAGARLEAEVIVGDQAYVRERAHLGTGTVIGRACTVDNDVRVGARARVQSNVYLTAHSIVEDDVFIGPGVTTTNDSTMGRHPPGEPLRGPVLRRACRIGGASVLTPGVEIGEEAFVAAGAVVIRDVPARAVVMGVPARMVRVVPDRDLLERWPAIGTSPQ